MQLYLNTCWWVVDLSQILQAPSSKNIFFQVEKEKSCREQTQVDSSTLSLFRIIQQLYNSISDRLFTEAIIRSPLPKLTRQAAVRFRTSCSGQNLEFLTYLSSTSPPIYILLLELPCSSVRNKISAASYTHAA